MSFNYKWVDNNFHVIFENATSYNEIVEAGNIVYGDKRFESMVYTIFNFINIENLELTRQELKIIAALDRSASGWNKNLKIACVINKDYLKEMFKYYKHLMIGGDWEIESFDNPENADKWCKQIITF